MIDTEEYITTSYSRGFPVGYMHELKKEHFIYNHVNIVVKCVLQHGDNHFHRLSREARCPQPSPAAASPRRHLATPAPPQVPRAVAG